MLEPADADALRQINDVSVDQYPEFAPIEVDYDHPEIEDLPQATEETLAENIDLGGLDPGAEIGITAGSRGVQDMPTMLAAIVEYLDDRGFEPFVFPAMGSHGGATAEGQREMLESLDVTPESMGCEVRSSMAVEPVGTTTDGRTVYVSTDALAADAVILANRIKPHTDFNGEIESGLCKIAVVGLGKQRGAETMHKSALDRSYEEAILERADIIFENAPVIGGVGMIENAHDHAAHVEAVPVDRIFEREPELQERAKQYLPMLPAEDLDVLIIDEIGKNISGTGMDTNVVGRFRMFGEEEPDTPSYDRIYVRSITDASHGNGVGMGIADMVSQAVIDELELTDMYINALTGGEPARADIPLIAPSDELALQLVVAATGVRDPGDLRVARIENTMEVDRALVSEPVADELRDAPSVSVGELRSLEFEGETLSPLGLGAE
ncbi:DUF2088 domain-containing protein [Natronomonas sp. F2-12]|uniref:DUF2088 domain-containing protein n=1 Tax=Natronomonas aquatica TaxID=2841590 RepID=A0A9R1CTX6_9EURY|nr:lactate racemase domain-containing protein [Natronomonas aquatica]MCQ4333945.1 DUF2088 domain-containing protein [Natronomonas aquatica]